MLGDKLELPEWWNLIDVAIYAGVPAWELMDKPKAWLYFYKEHAEAVNARHEVQAERMNRGMAN